jgi:NAD(P)-dependent dehydrogenase (short-subunit alcohol dehydrogenase family)
VRLPDLDGHRAVVSGAAGGIGHAVARALLDQGCVVWGIDVGEPPALGERYRHSRCDLADGAAIARTIAEIAREWPALDHLVNVAGVDPLLSLEEGGEREWDRIVDVDLRAYYLLIRAAAPLLRAGVGRSIVNLSSINYRLGVPKRSIYSTAKAGILGLTHGLARELGKDGIRINCVSPGWVFTERQRREYFEGPDSTKHLEHLHRVQSLPLHIAAEDIASHVLFYLSSASRASTGHNCVVDAGWLLE